MLLNNESAGLIKYPNNRIDYLDAAKGLAIIFVVCSHAGINNALCCFFYACYIPLFFICSGLTTPTELDSVRFARRVKKLLMAYFGISIILLLFSLLYLLLSGAEDVGVKMLKSVFGIFYSRFVIAEGQPHMMDIGNSPLWYLTCYIVVLLLFKAYSELPVSWRNHPVGFVCTAIVCLGVSAAWVASPILLPWSLDTAFMGVLFLICGICYRKYNVLSCLSAPVFLALLLVYSTLCFLNPSINMSVRQYGEHGCFSILAFGLIGCIGSLLWVKTAQLIYRYLPPVGTLLASVGRYTLFILGFSNLCLKLQTVLESKMLPQNDTWCTGILDVLKVMVSVALCCFCGYVWKKFRLLISPRG